jgi:SPP1 family predicted phage head-tail adaptor
MKNKVFPIDLIEIVTEKDDLNQVVEKTRTTKTVYGEIGSVSQTEFFSGGRIGLTPSMKAVIYGFEYNDEPIAKVNGKLYSIYRTYLTDGTDKIELYLEERGGTKDEPDPDDSTP